MNLVAAAKVYALFFKIDIEHFLDVILCACLLSAWQSIYLIIFYDEMDYFICLSSEDVYVHINILPYFKHSYFSPRNGHFHLLFIWVRIIGGYMLSRKMETFSHNAPHKEQVN